MGARAPGPGGLAAVEAYLSALPEEPRAALEKLRATIRETAPQAEEAMAYGVPAFVAQGKPLVCYAAFKAHCGFYPLDPALIAVHETALAPFTRSKGTIRFTPEKPLPAALVKEIVRARLAEVTARRR